MGSITCQKKRKKNFLTKNRPRTPCNIKSGSTIKIRVYDYLMSIPKIELVVGVVDRSEPSPRFAFNSINTKSGADNLQSNGLKKGHDANQVPIRRGSQNLGLSNSRTPSWR